MWHCPTAPKSGSRDPRAHRDWPRLSDLQKRAVMYVYEGEGSLVLCGAAGTGKSMTIGVLRDTAGPVITASTGIAASNINGVTLHSLLHWIPGESFGDWMRRIKSIVKKFIGVRILIVDEFLMFGDKDADRLDRMFTEIAKRDPARADTCRQPFGGYRFVFIGDPLQLEPVNQRPFFHAAAYATLAPRVIVLQRVFRQTAPLYLHLLGCMRLGFHTPLSSLLMLLLEHRAANLVARSNAMWLFAVRRLRDQCNFDGVRLYGRTVLFERSWEYDIDGPGVYQIGKKVHTVVGLVGTEGREPPAVPDVFSVGCPVRIVKNIDVEAGLVNGAIGVVEQIDEAARTITVRLASGARHVLSETKVYCRVWKLASGRKLVVWCWAMPVMPAVAGTVNGMQGLTATGAVAVVTEHPSATAALLYVAASRTTKMANLLPRAVSPKMARLKPNASALAFLAEHGLDVGAEHELLALQAAEMLPNVCELAAAELEMTHVDVARALRAVVANPNSRRLWPRHADEWNKLHF